MKFNHSKLLGRIKEKGIRQEDVADAINMNSGTLSQKLNGGSKFKTDEILAVCETLDIDPMDIPLYFFKK